MGFEATTQKPHILAQLLTMAMNFACLSAFSSYLFGGMKYTFVEEVIPMVMFCLTTILGVSMSNSHQMLYPRIQWQILLFSTYQFTNLISDLYTYQKRDGQSQYQPTYVGFKSTKLGMITSHSNENLFQTEDVIALRKLIQLIQNSGLDGTIVRICPAGNYEWDKAVSFLINKYKRTRWLTRDPNTMMNLSHGESSLQQKYDAFDKVKLVPELLIESEVATKDGIGTIFNCLGFSYSSQEAHKQSKGWKVKHFANTRCDDKDSINLYQNIDTNFYLRNFCPPERISSVGNLDVSEFLLLVDQCIGSFYKEMKGDDNHDQNDHDDKEEKDDQEDKGLNRGINQCSKQIQRNLTYLSNKKINNAIRMEKMEIQKVKNQQKIQNKLDELNSNKKNQKNSANLYKKLKTI